MILFESSIPGDRRQTVAGLIRSATVTCEVRRRFYTLAATHGLHAACAGIATSPGINRGMLALLEEELADIESELTRYP